jgi:phosphonate transport system substrate-binding protein
MNFSFSKLDKLRCVSYLAPNMFAFYKAVGAYLERLLGIETHVVQSQHDPFDDPVMLQEQLDVAFICGLPFAQIHRTRANQLQPLVAPVMQANRYQNRPVYFSDIIVNAESDLKTFENLAGKTFCYNDPGSNSGYNMLRQRLIQAGHPSEFFAQAIESGSHQSSMRLVAEKLADCAAIDSTVLEQELRDRPQLANHLRVIESIGPYPMPPVVAAQRLGSELINLLQSALCQPDAQLQSAMERSHIRRYVAVQSEDYALLSTLYDAAVKAGYEIIGKA